MSYNCPKNMLGDREPPPKKEKKKRKYESEEQYVAFYFILSIELMAALIHSLKINTSFYECLMHSDDHIVGKL